ncbi:MAG: PAS domain-containing sensor histidine kinase [Thermoanaerobaculales bacterium]
MRIQTRLFFGTATLVLALMAVQWWLHARQLRAIERDLGQVAAAVGREILSGDMAFIRRGFEPHPGVSPEVVSVGGGEVEKSTYLRRCSEDLPQEAHIQVVVLPEEATSQVTQNQEVTEFGDENDRRGLTRIREELEWIVETEKAQVAGSEDHEHELRRLGAGVGSATKVRRLILQVEDGESQGERFLIVSEDQHRLRRIPIPVSPTIERVRSTMHEGAAVGALLLVAGLFASGVLSRKLTQPLRALAEGAEAVGRGDLGVQVSVSAAGEVGDLQRSFNRMSARLTELETERERWQEREHLAQLGDLSRGLAHTLRNPLHTLGLAVDELADGDANRKGLARTARVQIQRIDRWLRSFLALGAEDAAQPVASDLFGLVQTVVLESVQQGADVWLERADEALNVQVVPSAMRAALANLVENAREASPVGEQVVVQIERVGDEGLVRVIDSGPGLSEDVRQRLYSPHVTTKAGGSGMGLYLARQLVVGMHGGCLEVEDGDGGGTVATVRLPLAIDSPESGDAGDG